MHSHSAGFPCGRIEYGLNRRQLLSRAGGGLGVLALASLLRGTDTNAAEPGLAGHPGAGPLSPKPGHFPAKAKSVIWLFMEGGPSAVDLFDPKPELTKRHGQAHRYRCVLRQSGPVDEVAFPLSNSTASAAPGSARQYPNVAKHVDDIAFIKSLLQRVEQSRAGAVPNEHRHAAARISICRCLDHLRLGEREPEACRATSCWATHQG